MLCALGVVAAVLMNGGAQQAAAATRVICGSGHAGKVRCHAIVVTNSLGSPTVSPGPRGLTPAVLRDAYQLPATTAGAGQVIAIVDAYDDPRAAIDLAAYRTQFHLGTCNNRGAAPCFRKVNQRGGAPLPRANEGWAGEISLDLDMASAICPRCRLLLVEADSSSVADLGLAEDAAARLGASVISNSFGGPESIGSAATAAHFHHPGVAIVASSGDDGFGTNFPASSGDVTAVGGTTLRSCGTAHGWTEQAWSGSGSGCSTIIARPRWQIVPQCRMRAVADVAAVADPATGVAVLDSYPLNGAGGWMVMGGTSAASPIIAGIWALAGNAASAGPGASHIYAHQTSLYDVKSGSNGICALSILCTAGIGFDGPSGLGAPRGIGAF